MGEIAVPDMKTSTAGILEIFEHEGVVPAPYLDSKGVWTWGVGHTAAAGDFDPAEMPRGMPSPERLEAEIDRAVRVFQWDIQKYESRVNAAIRVPLKQHEFDALVSFDYNTGGIHRARLTAAINTGNPDAARHFMGWLKPPEIRKRRTAEMKLFQTGNYDANGDKIAVWNVDSSGKLRGIKRTVRGKDLLHRFKQLDREAGVAARPVGGKPGIGKLVSTIVAIIKAFFTKGMRE